MRNGLKCRHLKCIYNRLADLLQEVRVYEESLERHHRYIAASLVCSWNKKKYVGNKNTAQLPRLWDLFFFTNNRRWLLWTPLYFEDYWSWRQIIKWARREFQCKLYENKDDFLIIPQWNMTEFPLKTGRETSHCPCSSWTKLTESSSELQVKSISAQF